jgi:hypothetical protein
MNRTALFFTPATSPMWDTLIYHHQNTFYLYYLTKAFGQLDGVGLAVSHDGVYWKDHGKVIEKAADATWLGSGAVWPVVDEASSNGKFIMNFSEWRGDQKHGRQTIFFAESSDLIHWARLGSEYEFRQDTRWYEPNGRWDNIWPGPRPGGGYYGYWAATPKGKKVGLGFGESDDGVNWKALEPPVLSYVPLGPPSLPSPEVGAVYVWRDRYYALVGLDDLNPQVNDDFTEFRPGHTTFVADSPRGPFTPAPKNRRLLVGNSSYFARFVDTPGGVLLNHHAWEILEGAPLGVNDDTTCMPPLKRAVWDDEGTLRLKWWTGNEKGKCRRVPVEPQLWDTAFDPKETLILEGEMLLASNPTGLYLQGAGDKGTGFLVYRNGRVEYGDICRDGAGFEKKGYVDRDLVFADTARIRLIRRGRITEFYLDDHLMQCYCLPEQGTGRISVIGSAANLRQLAAWYCA